jgi:hypothetical protein
MAPDVRKSLHKIATAAGIVDLARLPTGALRSFRLAQLRRLSMIARPAGERT